VTDTTVTAETPESIAAEEAAAKEAFVKERSEPEAQQPEAAEEQDSPQSSESGADTAVEQPEKAKEGTPEDATRSSEVSAEAEAEKPKSSYQARRSERDQLIEDQKRLAESWRKLDEGKLKWQENLNRELATLKQQLAQQQNRPPRNEPTAEEYAMGAKELEKRAREAALNGEVEKADQLLGLASQARDKANQGWMSQQQQQWMAQHQQLEHAWLQNAEQIIAKHPELEDHTQGEGLEVAKIIQQYPVLKLDPNGFQMAVEYREKVKLAAEASGLREKLTQTEKRLSELQSKTQITGGGVTPHVNPKSFDDMTPDEQDDYLRDQAKNIRYFDMT